MSAPATNPLAFAELITTPTGLSAAISLSLAASSLRTEADRTLVEAPGTSQVSHAMRSASTSSFQVPAALMGSGRRLSRLAHREIADQREVIGQLDVRYLEAVHLDLRAVQDEIELLARRARRIGGQAAGV